MPSFIDDEPIWEKAKAAAAKSGKGKNYAIVMSIYKKMGGRIKGKVMKSIGTTIADLLKGKPRYQEGQRWQQKSGRWVMKLNGKIVPIKKGRKKKKVEKVADQHAAAAHEDEKKNIKKVKDDATKTSKPKDGKAKPGAKSKPAKKHKTLKEQFAEHQATQQHPDTDKGSGGAGAGDIQGSAGAVSGEVSTGAYSAGGREILVGRPDLSQLPEKNHLAGNIVKGMHRHQADATNLAIEAFEKGAPAFLNADGTGAGKTTEILGLAAHYAPKSAAPVLVVTKNANIIAQNFTNDAKRMGLTINHVKHPDDMKAGAINICTYSALSTMAKRVSVADDKLGVLVKHAWAAKDADEFRQAVGAEGLTPEGAYAIFAHTGYAKTFMDNYYKDQSTCVKKAFDDFHAYCHGKSKANFQWSGKAMKAQKKMGNVVSNSTISDAKKTSMVLFDEAHELKNADSGQSENGLAMMEASGKTGLFTATPLDKPEHIHYIAHAFGLDYKKVLGYAGYSVDNKGNTTTNMPMEERMNLLGNIFGNMTKNGHMVKREVSLKNMDLKSHIVDMDEADKRKYNEAEAFWDDKLEAAGGGPARMNVAGQMTLAMRRLNESFKVKHIVSKAIEDLKAGRQAVLFFDNVGKKGEKMKLHKEHTMEYESSVNMARDHFAEELKKHPDLAHVKIAEFHGQMTAGARKRAQAEFQSGKSHVFITTPKSGGTGINLDDITGNAPRAIHIATAPYSANEFIQILGRGNRVTTKSRLNVHLHVSDTAADDKNVDALVKKTKTLGASVEGDYAGLKVPDKYSATLPGMQGYEEIGDQWDAPDRPFIPMNMDNFKKEVLKSLRNFVLSMVVSALYSHGTMLKAYSSVGPQGGHYHLSATGHKVYETEHGQHYHKEIAAANHPDIVTNHILKMDHLNSKGQLSDNDMQKLMGHAAERMKALMNAKASHENKARAQRVAVATHKRQTTEGARKARKERTDSKLKKRILTAKKRIELYKERAEKLKAAHGHYSAHKAAMQKKMAEIQPEIDKLKQTAGKLRHYKETMTPSHPQYQNLIAAIQKHSAKVKEVLPHYEAAKKGMADADAKMQRILELHNKGRGAIRAYTQAAKEDIDTMRKSLIADMA